MLLAQMVYVPSSAIFIINLNSKMNAMTVNTGDIVLLTTFLEVQYVKHNVA